MGQRSKQAEDQSMRLALSLVDLRAHFEAQLRTVAHAEQCLVKCRGAHDAVSFDAAANTLRAELQAVADNRDKVSDLVRQIVADAQRLAFTE